jgi:hypothetical protein
VRRACGTVFPAGHGAWSFHLHAGGPFAFAESRMHEIEMERGGYSSILLFTPPGAIFIPAKTASAGSGLSRGGWRSSAHCLRKMNG